jgi:hypothetical protein
MGTPVRKAEPAVYGATGAAQKYLNLYKLSNE